MIYGRTRACNLILPQLDKPSPGHHMGIRNVLHMYICRSLLLIILPMVLYIRTVANGEDMQCRSAEVCNLI